MVKDDPKSEDGEAMRLPVMYREYRRGNAVKSANKIQGLTKR